MPWFISGQGRIERGGGLENKENGRGKKRRQNIEKKPSPKTEEENP